MIDMTDEHRRTIKWQKVTQGPLRYAGVKTFAACRKYPLVKDNKEWSIVGYNDMLRGQFVWYTPKLPEDQPRMDPFVCQIAGVSPRGVFRLKEVDPPSQERAEQEILTTPEQCRPAPEFNLGKRII